MRRIVGVGGLIVFIIVAVAIIDGSADDLSFILIPLVGIYAILFLEAFIIDRYYGTGSLKPRWIRVTEVALVVTFYSCYFIYRYTLEFGHLQNEFRESPAGVSSEYAEVCSLFHSDGNRHWSYLDPRLVRSYEVVIQPANASTSELTIRELVSLSDGSRWIAESRLVSESISPALLNARPARRIGFPEPVVRIREFPAGMFVGAYNAVDLLESRYFDSDTISWTLSSGDRVEFSYYRYPWHLVRSLLDPLLGVYSAYNALIATIVLGSVGFIFSKILERAWHSAQKRALEEPKSFEPQLRAQPTDDSSKQGQKKDTKAP